MYTGDKKPGPVILEANATCLERELDWFTRVLEARISLYFEQKGQWKNIYEIDPPPINGDSSEYGQLVDKYKLNFDERIILMLALIPHVRPQTLDSLFIRNKNLDRSYTEFGGFRAKAHSGFLPSCETAAFILAGDDLNRRFQVMRMLEPDHVFLRKGILKLQHEGPGEPFLSAGLGISVEYLNLLTTGQHQKPDFGIDFPAKLISTPLTWDDLVLSPDVLDEIRNINTWLRASPTIMADWGLRKSIKPGFRSLFYGPPGTGKTLTATLIGAEADIDVYRIDLSMIVSKYIGETEKNLANVFDQAQNKNWILFFDEADALFGKRTQQTNSNDRHANQEISYLLQRVEDFPGVVILATNLKANIDEAFARRFQSVIYFPMPDAEQRLRLWKGVFNNATPRAADVDLEWLSEEYELSGGAIINVVRYAAIRALQETARTVTQQHLLDGIVKERLKEGKTA